MGFREMGNGDPDGSAFLHWRDQTFSLLKCANEASMCIELFDALSVQAQRGAESRPNVA